MQNTYQNNECIATQYNEQGGDGSKGSGTATRRFGFLWNDFLRFIFMELLNDEEFIELYHKLEDDMDVIYKFYQ